MTDYLIDSRSHSQYIGWIFEQTPFQGHIKGALNIDVRSLDQQFLQSQIAAVFKKQDNFVIYDAGNGEAQILAATLNKLGHKKSTIRLQHFKNFNISEHQFEYCKNYQKLVPPEYVISRKQEQQKDCFIQIVQFGYLKNHQFQKWNIPGSVYLDSTQLQIQPQYMLKSKEELISIITKHGLSELVQTIIVNRGNLTGNKKQGWSIMPSARLAIILNSLGFSDVKILNGGVQAFQKLLKRPQNRKIIINQTKKQENKLGSQNLNKQLIVQFQDFKRLRQSSQVCIVDTRTQKQFKGLKSGYAYCERKGKIQNSVFHGFSSSKCAQSMKDYQFFSRMKSFEHILPKYANSKIDVSKKLIFYCGNGWRASQVAFYFLVHGYSQIFVYSNGWMQWSRKTCKFEEVTGQSKQNFN